MQLLLLSAMVRYVVVVVRVVRFALAVTKSWPARVVLDGLDARRGGESGERVLTVSWRSCPGRGNVIARSCRGCCRRWRVVGRLGRGHDVAVGVARGVGLALVADGDDRRCGRLCYPGGADDGVVGVGDDGVVAVDVSATARLVKMPLALTHLASLVYLPCSRAVGVEREVDGLGPCRAVQLRCRR